MIKIAKEKRTAYRHKMRRKGQQIKYDLLEQRISDLENKIEQIIPTLT